MHKEGEEIHIDETEASGGSKEGVVRWVLAGGLLLAVILLSITWIIPAMTTGDVEEEGTVSGQISSMEDGSSDTDSIVTDLGDDEATTQQDLRESLRQRRPRRENRRQRSKT